MRKIIIVLSFVGLMICRAVIAQTGIGLSDSGFLTSLPPDAPALCSPADKAVDLPDSATVVWNSRIHTSYYTLQLSTKADFMDLFFSETCTDTALTVTNLSTNTSYHWRVFATNVAGDGDFSETRQFTTASFSDVEKKMSSIPKDYALLPAYPNPFNPVTTITYHLPEKSEVSLVIYNNIGQSVQELVSGQRQAGEYKVTWDCNDNRGASVTSGVYICFFKAENRIFTQKILLIR